MNESGLWNYLRQGMAGRWLATRIESSAGNGVPDVLFAMSGKFGWIELKHKPEWPKRPNTKIKLPLRPEQRLWINTRGKLAGNTWVLIRIKDHFYLLNYIQASDACEGWTHLEWGINCTNCWYKQIDFNDLAEVLK